MNLKVHNELLSSILYFYIFYNSGTHDICVQYIKSLSGILIEISIYRWPVEVTIYDNFVAVEVTIYDNFVTVEVTIYDNFVTVEVTIYDNFVTVEVTIYDNFVTVEVTIYDNFVTV